MRVKKDKTHTNLTYLNNGTENDFARPISIDVSKPNTYTASFSFSFSFFGGTYVIQQYVQNPRGSGILSCPNTRFAGRPPPFAICTS
ncbi:hypothetical protein M378DRAFT_857331 [Amanita muscaria Koide BX008]|uniref:Uncharacterized protein n=1 Tax=Amanita muscaria (strain Koide BX008) TaxID=946122 RepID=A0A0C2WII5_AMAMK|nr:hypothetical protein M378DRAFT_857331 [Amanita muscaria Koide BX008]